ncbi:hypothetical protein LDENG_00288430, partial [Lucifuga dentata]
SKGACLSGNRLPVGASHFPRSYLPDEAPPPSDTNKRYGTSSKMADLIGFRVTRGSRSDPIRTQNAPIVAVAATVAATVICVLQVSSQYQTPARPSPTVDSSTSSQCLSTQDSSFILEAASQESGSASRNRRDQERKTYRPAPFTRCRGKVQRLPKAAADELV